MLKSKASMKANAPMIETGMAMTGMSVARKDCRKMKITRTTSPTASRIVHMRSVMEAMMKSVAL